MLTLPTGETFPVYRVKTWTFNHGTTSLQLEYEPPFSVADTAGLRATARQLWPFFAPYVEAQRLQGAIITATNLKRAGIWPLAWATTMKHYGLILERHENGQWYFDGDTIPLPQADTLHDPSIREADGRMLPFAF